MSTETSGALIRTLSVRLPELGALTFYLRDLILTGATIASPGIFHDLVGNIGCGEIKPYLAKQYSGQNLGRLLGEVCPYLCPYL